MIYKTFLNLHYTLLLLILIEGFIKKDNYSIFTLHFATINTQIATAIIQNLTIIYITLCYY